MKSDHRVYCVVMRGGTSKAVFFHKNDLPDDPEQRDRVIMRVFGSPDKRQIDGLGGANSSTSKVAVISVSSREDADIDYDFGQVSVDKPIIVKTMNCGNISSAVGPFAIDEGLVPITEPETVVRIFNTNTRKHIIAHVPVKNGKTLYEGDYSIDGVPGTASRINIEFEDPSGAVTGKKLPTGNPMDEVIIEGKTYHVSLVDAANPVVFIRAEELGLNGTELPWEYEALPNYKQVDSVIEQIRCWACKQVGFVTREADGSKLSPGLPKVGFLTKNIGYVNAEGKFVSPEHYDLTGRLFSMGKMIHAYMGTGTVCTMVAANTRGTVINELVRDSLGDNITMLRIGHPFGIIDVSAKVVDGEVKSATIGRTARRIMEGWAYLD